MHEASEMSPCADTSWPQRLYSHEQLAQADAPAVSAFHSSPLCRLSAVLPGLLLWWLRITRPGSALPALQLTALSVLPEPLTYSALLPGALLTMLISF